jgi:hypothetical protein
MTFNSHRRADILKNSDNAAWAGDYLSSKQRRQGLTENSVLRKSAWRKKDVPENDGPYEIDDVDNLDDILRELNK